MATASGMAQLSLDDFDKWGEYWRFTSLSARLLFEEVFQTGSVTVYPYGNVLAAVSFLEGLAVEDLKKKELDAVDRSYEVLMGFMGYSEPQLDNAMPSASERAILRAMRPILR